MVRKPISLACDNLHYHGFDRGRQQDRYAEARIYFNLTHSTSYNHPSENQHTKTNLTVVMLTGSNGNANKIVKDMYLSLSKIYYAKRHGYKFVQQLSNRFEAYFPHDLFKVRIF